MSKQVGILGCGWLGTPLATSLLEAGYGIRGTTTDVEKLVPLEELGVVPFRILLTEKGVEGPLPLFLEGLDTLRGNIPPGLRKQPEADFLSKIRILDRALTEAGTARLLFVSSTAVFSDAQGAVVEQTPPEPGTRSGRQQLQAENLLLQNPSRKTMVLRLGGLMGPDRHPVTHLSGREIPSGGNQRVNLIRMGDALGALRHLIANPRSSGIYHGVYPAHPTRRDFYTSEARLMRLDPPRFMDPAGPAAGKTVRSTRLQREGFHFSHSIYSSENR